VTDRPADDSAARDPGAAVPDGDDEGADIPVVEVEPAAPPARPGSGVPSAARPPAPDWTRAEPVRDDPGTLGEEARKLWDTVRDQFVDPLLRNYPEAAGHLSTAGSEFAAALRALVRGAERRWTDSEQHPEDGSDGRTAKDEDADS
jgi:Family of unknown function (DUF5304)